MFLTSTFFFLLRVEVWRGILQSRQHFSTIRIVLIFALVSFVARSFLDWRSGGSLANAEHRPSVEIGSRCSDAFGRMKQDKYLFVFYLEMKWAFLTVFGTLSGLMQWVTGRSWLEMTASKQIGAYVKAWELGEVLGVWRCSVFFSCGLLVHTMHWCPKRSRWRFGNTVLFVKVKFVPKHFLRYAGLLLTSWFLLLCLPWEDYLGVL